MTGETIYESFRAAAWDAPDNSFLCYPSSSERLYLTDGAEFSYSQGQEIIDALADRYRAAGYTAGHRVALLAGNRPDHFWHLFALNRIGACAVTLNPDYRSHELAYAVEFPRCAAIVAAHPALDKAIDVARTLARPIPVIDVHAPDATLPPPAHPPFAIPEAPGARPALIIYTSGTTGRPKGCIISNDSCHAAAESYGGAGGIISFRTGGDRLYMTLPSFHMNLSVFCLNSIVKTRNCLIVQERFSLSRWWSDIIAARATCFQYLGIIPPLLIKTDPDPQDRAHQLRFGYGAGVDPQVRETFEDRFGVPLIEAWGMTETSRAIHNSQLPRCLEPRAFGCPLPPWEVRIVDGSRKRPRSARRLLLGLSQPARGNRACLARRLVPHRRYRAPARRRDAFLCRTPQEYHPAQRREYRSC
jgi:acyl-CoA synthetase (AMP-forming)/AMP-acid ligase II